MENKQEDLKSTKEILFKYENRPTGWQLDDILQAMAEYADQFKKQLKEKEDELNDWKKNAKDYNDRIIDEEIAGKLLKLIPSDEDIEKLGEKWLGGKFNYATYHFFEFWYSVRSLLLNCFCPSIKPVK